MHGVMMGLEVLGRAFVAGDQEDIKSSLAATESSGYTLQTILNDVLDFGKWTTMMEDDSPSSPADLVEIATRAMMICSAHYSSMGFNPDIELEYDDHDFHERETLQLDLRSGREIVYQMMRCPDCAGRVVVQTIRCISINEYNTRIHET